MQLVLALLASTPTQPVVINGKTLDNKTIAALEAQYGVQPEPGRYWYDKKSGLFGVVGYAAMGFMRPGHAFGRLKRKVSGGDTHVIVNGRELPQDEWLIWSTVIGTPIAPGRYWLDAAGNAGLEGNPMPLVNFYLAFQQRMQQQQYAQPGQHRATGGGGDNFWSTRFSAGNSTADGSAGYVSVPGHGPIGYGF